MKLCRWSLGYKEEFKTLEMAKMWNVYWRKVSGSGQSQGKREAMWAATIKSRPSGWSFPEPVRGASILTLCALHSRHGVPGVHVFSEEFWLHFDPIFALLFLVLNFGMGMLTLCHCTMGSHNLFLLFQGVTDETLPCAKGNFQLGF